MADGPYCRRSARVLLVDAADRILLLSSYLDLNTPERGQAWFTPGGGVSEGEPLQAAAARELHEETGLAVDPEDLEAPVAHTSGYADLGWATGVFRDDLFLYRVDRHVVDGRGLEAHEIKHMTGHRWWTLDELAATTETVYPFGLATLLADLLAGRIPAEAVRLPWHH